MPGHKAKRLSVLAASESSQTTLLAAPAQGGSVMSERHLTSQRPYLIRAMYEWITDNSLTPHIVVNAEADSWGIPKQSISDGKAVLNISYAATRNLDLTTDWISFDTRFRGIAQRVNVPSSAIIRIFAKETIQGITFADEESQPPNPDKPPKRPTLKSV